MGDGASVDCIIAVAENRRVIPDCRVVAALEPEIHCMLWTMGVGVNQMTIRNNKAGSGTLTVATGTIQCCRIDTRSIRQVAAIA